MPNLATIVVTLPRQHSHSAAWRLPYPLTTAARLPLLLLVMLPGSAAPGPYMRQEAPPAGVADLVARAQAALKSGDRAAVRGLAADPAAMAWLDYAPGRGAPNWSIAPLRLPESAGRDVWIAVFYDFHTCESIGDHVHKLVETAAGWRFGPEILETDTRGYRVRDHALTVAFDFPGSACAVTDDLKIQRLNSAAGPCLLRLSSDMQVDSATIGGRDAGASHVPGVIALPPRAESTYTLHLTYHGSVNHSGSDYIRPTEVVLCSYWYPHIARLPAAHSVTAAVPKGWTAVGEGELLNRAENADSTVFTFRNPIPTCYFTLDAGPYKITLREAGGRKLATYELTDRPGRAENSLDTLGRALSFFEKTFGPYPYSHYELVETRGPFDGALEAYSFSTYNRGDFGAVVHELSHTWWGGIVPCPYTRTMWNESFASYSSGLYSRMTSANPPAHALAGAHRVQDQGRSSRGTFAVPILEAYDTQYGPHSAVGYGKGATVLAMLEDLLGTPRMIRCLRRFVKDHRPGEAADWEDFEGAVRQETNERYAWFFNQWLKRPGLPTVSLGAVRVLQVDGRPVVEAKIRQQGQPYRLRLPIVMETVDGKTVRQNADVAGSESTVRIPLESMPRALRLDPDGNVLLAPGQPSEPGADPLNHRF